MILVSDPHSCYYTFLRLLAKCPREDVANLDIVLLGDLIDRGPNAKQMVEWMMANRVRCVVANHEDLCLAYHNVKPNCSSYYQPDIWAYPGNGGLDTLKSFDPSLNSFRLPDNVLNWMSQLPAYIVDPRFPKLLLSHTGHGKAADKGDRFNALWRRDPVFKADGLFRVFGHTPHNQPVITKTYANIDTGAAYGDRGFDTMTALIWPTMEIVQQVYDETPISITA